ncbi:hypothetical protein LTR84_001207 [Exophiala bonariae]|uniref:Uncharacterized protein n=1 Tax=Exophiala bonariae TaxID=1690606 RepID=A0AAV9NSS3_9EURO|nr:hypothetical protein LTR84_001207 [Exophiala bonariae]
MLSARPGFLAICPPSDSSAYTSFSGDQGLRSPRTPTYIPESMAVTSSTPYDHTKALDENSSIHSDNTRMSLPPTPDQPLAWIWVCHLCHSRYPLGVTRRCLVDGHYYCSGEANQPNLRKKKKRQSCTSEFDYVAWREWGEWKKKAAKILKSSRLGRGGGSGSGCENCVYPSQCRYPPEVKDQVEKPAQPKTTAGTTVTISSSPEVTPPTTIQATPQREKNEEKVFQSTSNENVSFDQILHGIFTDEKTAMKIDSAKKEAIIKKKGNGSGKRKNPQHQLAYEEEMANEAARLKELVGVELWNNLEDIDLGNLKRKVD